jgi:Mg-chelatase subunit ChlD
MRVERYELLASAVAGRAIGVAGATDNSPTYSDGNTIFLADGDDPGARIIGLGVQAAMLAAHSLRPSLMRRLVGRPALARRYLALEAWRALSALDGVIPPMSVGPAPLQLTSTPEDSMWVAQSRTPIADPPPAFGTIRPRAVLSRDRSDPTAPAAGNRPESQGGLQRLELDDDESQESSVLALLSSPNTSNNLVAKLLAKAFGLGRQRSSDPGGAELPIGAARSARQGGRHTDASLFPANLEPLELPATDGGGVLYPEWDAGRRCYRPQWCAVYETSVPLDGLRPLEHRPNDRISRQLARLGAGLERRRRQMQGDVIDLDAAMEAQVEILSGSAPSEGLYVENQRRRRSLAVLLLLDVSGSSGESGSSAVTVHERQRRAAADLLEALYVLGDRVSLYGFRSEGRSAVTVSGVKSFDEPLTGVCFDRLAALTPGGFTRLGAAIRHATHVLDRYGGTDQRLLVVLSDGFPYDAGDGYDGSYGEADARRALGEARRRGIGCLCLTLGSSTDTGARRRVFGSAAHASAEELDDLAPLIGKLFRRAIASAETQRRVAERHRATGPRPETAA